MLINLTIRGIQDLTNTINTTLAHSGKQQAALCTIQALIKSN
jgi:hypothetical protein